MSSWRQISWRIAAVAFVVFLLFFELGGRALNEPDEGRYAGIGYEMSATGDWLTPRLDGFEHFAKPPLTYWLIAASMSAFGVNEFAARLPATLAALGTLLAVYALVKSARDETTALWAVVMLATTAMFFVVARLITTDMLLTCWTTCAIACAWRWYVSEHRRWGAIMWFYVFLGLIFLTKGPVGLALVAFALAGLRWRNPAFALSRMHWGKGLLVFLIIALPWFLAVAGRHPELLRYFVVRETVERVATDVHGRREAWWFFLAVLPAGCLPWVAMAPAVWKLRGEGGRTHDLMRLCVSWAGLGLVMFSVSHSKLPTYILPLVPAVVMLAALGWGRVCERGTWAGERLARGCGVAVLVLVAGLLVGGALYAQGRYKLSRSDSGLVGVAAAVTLVAGGVGLVRRQPCAAGAALVGGAAALLVTAVLLLPRVERNMSGQTSAKFLAERIHLEDPGRTAEVVSLHTFLRGLPLYLQRRVLWYYPRHARGKKGAMQEAVFEFTSPRDDAPNLLLQPAQVRALAAGAERVFFVASDNEAERLQDELKITLYELERSGKRVLLSNRP